MNVRLSFKNFNTFKESSYLYQHWACGKNWFAYKVGLPTLILFWSESYEQRPTKATPILFDTFLSPPLYVFICLEILFLLHFIFPGILPFCWIYRNPVPDGSHTEIPLTLLSGILWNLLLPWCVCVSSLQYRSSTVNLLLCFSDLLLCHYVLLVHLLISNNCSLTIMSQGLMLNTRCNKLKSIVFVTCPLSHRKDCWHFRTLWILLEKLCK